MSVITISREIGASGTYIALKVAEALKGTCFDQQIINDIAIKMGKDKKQIELFDQQTYSRVGVFFQEALDSIAQGGMVFHPFGIGPLDWDSTDAFNSYPKDFFQEDDYCEVLSQVIKELATQPNSIILGRAAGKILRGYSDSLHVRIVADLSERVKHVMKEQNIDESKAESLIKDKDKASTNFVYDFFDEDINNAHNYHLILNTSRITPDNCVQIILNNIGHK